MGWVTRQTRGFCAALAAAACAAPACSAPPRESATSPAPPADAWTASGRAEVAHARALRAARGPEHARNVILFVGDGMGVSTVTAARILEGQLRGEPGEENRLSFEELPYLALAKTYNTNQQVPDSAGTMTAMVTGRKTRAGVLSVAESVERGDAAGARANPLRTLFEEAEDRGLATGVVTTARLTHATPAAGYAHSPERDWEDDTDLPEAARAIDFPDIARQLIEFGHGDGLEVAMGGGRANFLPRETTDPEHPKRAGRRSDGRDLTREWTARPGAAYVWNADQLASLDLAGTRHLLGLFEPSHMRWEADREGDPGGEPALTEMALAALEIVSRDPDGYVLVVEAGRIDHGHHAGNAWRALLDTIELSDAVRAILARVSLDDTLVLVTADHSHTLTISGYPTRGNPILGLVRGNDGRGNPSGETMNDAIGRPYTTLGYANGPGAALPSTLQPAGAKRFPHPARTWKAGDESRPDQSELDTTAPQHLQEAAVPLYAETHAGEDVPIYAAGPGAPYFHGVREQSYLYHAAVDALGWR